MGPAGCRPASANATKASKRAIAPNVRDLRFLVVVSINTCDHAGICPHDKAWSMEPGLIKGSDQGHDLYECSNRGHCDRENGVCLCMFGFTGLGCQRSKSSIFLRSFLSYTFFP
jgi:hypothetical protein